jgi:CheY-like chemotaxis protein
MTGFELCRVVKDRFPHLFVIGLTGSSRMRDFDNAGAHTRYQKPVQFSELQLAIENRFEIKRAAAG